MQDEMMQHVNLLLQHGIRLKSRLMQGEPLILENEQALLKKMLLSEREAQRWPDYGGDPYTSSGKSESGGRSGALTMPYLGIRYALVCWLDEIFLVDSQWDSRWNENKLELAFYGTNDRAWHFWEQARLAEMRPGTEALSAFFLCVMLGFRGDLRDSPNQLQGWVENTRRRMLRSERLVWTRPPELTPVTNVPPLRGRESLRRMVVSGGFLMLVLIPLLAIFLVVLFVQPHQLPFGSGKIPTVVAPEKSDRFPEELP